MAREINEDREFSENIDRLLAGQEIEVGEDVSKDFRTAIQFAQKLEGLRDQSSPAFKDQLRRRLLVKLAATGVQVEQAHLQAGILFGTGLVHLLNYLKRQHDIADLAGFAVPDQFHLSFVAEKEKTVLVR